MDIQSLGWFLCFSISLVNPKMFTFFVFQLSWDSVFNLTKIFAFKLHGNHSTALIAFCRKFMCCVTKDLKRWWAKWLLFSSASYGQNLWPSGRRALPRSMASRSEEKGEWNEPETQTAGRNILLQVQSWLYAVARGFCFWPGHNWLVTCHCEWYGIGRGLGRSLISPRTCSHRPVLGIVLSTVAESCEWPPRCHCREQCLNYSQAPWCCHLVH